MTGTPIAFRRVFVCITWERNLVPVIRSNSEFCSVGFPPELVSQQRAGLTLSQLQQSLWPPGEYSMTSNPLCLPDTHNFLHQHKCVVFMMTPVVQVSGDTELWVRVCMVCTWPSFSGTTLDLHWCKITWSEAQGQQDCAQTDLYIK